jgi:hypothetical protein
MAHLHLPADHDESDLAMAGALAGVLGSADLYVTWSSAQGAARPVIPATVPDGCGPRRRRRRLSSLLGVLGVRRKLERAS